MKGSAEPTLIQAGAIGIDAFDEMPVITELCTQVFVFAESASEEFNGHAADGFVGMGRAEQEGIG